jgi:hypothetical protein
MRTCVCVCMCVCVYVCVYVSERERGETYVVFELMFSVVCEIMNEESKLC